MPPVNCAECRSQPDPSVCHPVAPPRRIVLTGGPGAGKTAVLEVIRHHFCHHVQVLAESASILFGGGFPRRDDFEPRKATQVAIYHVQSQLERIAMSVPGTSLFVCDRGTIDGAAYWPDTTDSFWSEVGSSRDREYARYDTVIHLRVPQQSSSYTHSNPFRTESLAEALEIDARIAIVWSGHPQVLTVEATPRFLDKIDHVLSVLRERLPTCCVQRLAHVAEAAG